MKKFFLSLLCLGLITMSCSNDDNDPVVEEEEIENPEEEEETVEVDIEVQNFFWQTLKNKLQNEIHFFRTMKEKNRKSEKV